MGVPLSKFSREKINARAEKMREKIATQHAEIQALKAKVARLERIARDERDRRVAEEAGGDINLAAQFLGAKPETLATRMRRADLRGERIEDE